MEQQEQRSGLMMPALGAVGVVYGDIGTSPLYTIQTIFGEGGVPVSSSNIVGAISAVFWALMLVVTLKYVVLVMRADNHGEGGIISLLAMAVTATASQSLRRKLILLGALKTALFYSRTYQRLLRRGLSELHDDRFSESTPLARAFARLQQELDAYTEEKLVA